jgi:hypothetical protein
VTSPLQNNLGDLTEIIAQITVMLPELSSFISQFNNLVVESNINVVTDTSGNMSVDVPASMSDTQASTITKKIGIIDRLINSHGTSLSDLFKKGLDIEKNIQLNDPSYTSQLTEKVSVFKELNASYKH